jgi:ubiquinone/menaquinone biosynthesis C-methylase UbiE
MDAISPYEEQIRDYHRNHVGTTPLSFADAEVINDTSPRQSSYDWLANRVPKTGRPIRLLDLGCGCGWLLSLLAARNQPGLTMIGVDISSDELTLAAKRLDGAALLLEARAQALPLSPATVDIVLSHLAIMVMSDMEAVVDNIRNVLVPGGEFACVVWSRALPGDVSDLLMQELREAIRSEPGALRALGDARTVSANGLRSLFHHGFHLVEMTDLAVRKYGTANAIWDALVPNYDTYRLSPGNIAMRRQSFIKKVEHLSDNNGIIECTLEFRSLIVRRD